MRPGRAGAFVERSSNYTGNSRIWQACGAKNAENPLSGVIRIAGAGTLARMRLPWVPRDRMDGLPDEQGPLGSNGLRQGLCRRPRVAFAQAP